MWSVEALFKLILTRPSYLLRACRFTMTEHSKNAPRSNVKKEVFDEYVEQIIHVFIVLLLKCLKQL